MSLDTGFAKHIDRNQFFGMSLISDDFCVYQAALGARLWSERVGLVAPVGQDFVQEMLSELEMFSDIDTAVRLNPCTHKKRFSLAQTWLIRESDAFRPADTLRQ